MPLLFSKNLDIVSVDVATSLETCNAAWIDRFFPIPEEERSKFHVHARPSNSLPANHIF